METDLIAQIPFLKKYLRLDDFLSNLNISKNQSNIQG